MTINAVAVPTPPNSNMDRAMFLWVPATGNSGVIGSDANIQSVLNWCSSKGVNVIFLDMWKYLGAANWTAGNQQQMAKFIHYCHASGIRVYALAGDTTWGQQQGWVASNIIKAIAQFNAIAQTGSITNEAGAFDGLIFDVEYYTVTGYTTADPIGLCDLMHAARRVLNIPVGCFVTQWLADSSSAALSFSYDGGPVQLEGLNLMDNADFVAVGCYSNNSTTQIAQFNNWYSYASATASARDFGLFCGSEVGQGLGNQSYWTGSPGALATLETAQTAISAAYTSSGTPWTNMSFLGACIDPYSSYSQMT